jgi:hypothetical protein
VSTTVAAPRAKALLERRVLEARREAYLRRQLEDRFEGTYERRPQYKQLDWLVLVCLWITAAQTKEGPRFQRTWPQIARALGLDLTGLSTVRAIKDHYENPIKRTLTRLAEMGLVEFQDGGKAWQTVYDELGESTGIVVALTSAGVAQSVRTTEFEGVRSRRGVTRMASPSPPPRSSQDVDERGRGLVFSKLKVVPPSCGALS